MATNPCRGLPAPVAVGFALVVMLLRNASAAARDLAAWPAGVLASSQPLAAASLASSPAKRAPVRMSGLFLVPSGTPESREKYFHVGLAAENLRGVL